MDISRKPSSSGGVYVLDFLCHRVEQNHAPTQEEMFYYYYMDCVISHQILGRVPGTSRDLRNLHRRKNINRPRNRLRRQQNSNFAMSKIGHLNSCSNRGMGSSGYISSDQLDYVFVGQSRKNYVKSVGMSNPNINGLGLRGITHEKPSSRIGSRASPE